MKLTAPLILAATMCAASTLPVVTPDGPTVAGPGIGARVIAQPGQFWLIGGNEGTDFDYNEPLALASFGPTSFVLDLIGSISAIQGNFLGVHNQSGRVGALQLPTATYLYTPGLEVPIFFEAGTGQRYEPGSQNIFAACINCDGDQPDTQTPEPMSLALVCAGLISSWWVRRK
jgi:hypothetical protein